MPCNVYSIESLSETSNVKRIAWHGALALAHIGIEMVSEWTIRTGWAKSTRYSISMEWRIEEIEKRKRRFHRLNEATDCKNSGQRLPVGGYDANEQVSHLRAHNIRQSFWWLLLLLFLVLWVCAFRYVHLFGIFHGPQPFFKIDACIAFEFICEFLFIRSM